MADALGMRAVIVPPRAGVLSAVGLVSSPRQRELVRSWPTPAPLDGLDGALDRARRRGVGGWSVAAHVEVETFVDCRYAGQSHELTVAEPDDFPAEHERRNGYARPGAPIEVVALRARARARRAASIPPTFPPVARGASSAPRSWPSPTARSGCPTGGSPSPAALGAWCWCP